MKPIILLCLGLVAGFVGGCSKPETDAPKTEAVHKHEHHPPHGGAPVELGEEENHVEFVLDAPNGKLQAFVLDGELENYVRIAQESLEVTAKVAGRDEKLVLQAVANRATGETVGDTSLFEAQADWLRKMTNFDAVLKEVTVHGKIYTNIVFNYPKGNDGGSPPHPVAAQIARGEKIESSQPAPNNTAPPPETMADFATNKPPVIPVAVPAAPPEKAVPDSTTLAGAIAAFATNRPPAIPAAVPTEPGKAVPDSASLVFEKDGDYLVTGFDKLASFTFVSSEKLHPTDPWEKIKQFIPAPLLALDGQKVEAKGFMLPLKVQDGLVREFLLLRSQMTCCYGRMPFFNEWIDVYPEAKNLSPVMDVPITVYGTLHLKDFRENGRLEGIYEMDCERIVKPNE